MRYLKPFILSLSGVFLLLAVNSFVSKNDIKKELQHQVFVGTSPCAQSARSFLKIPASEKCDNIKWKLELVYDESAKKPSGFTLEREYTFIVDNRTDKSQGVISVKGDWKLTKGTKEDADAVVYELRSGDQSISFLQVDENLMHLLEPDKSLCIGDGGQSFTLSKKMATPPSSKQLVKGTTLASSDIKDTMIRFVGRTPCQEIAKELSLKTNPDCIKLKWDLRLFQDPVSFAPTKYELRRTLHRQSVIVGKWKIIKISAPGSKDVLFQLDPDKEISQYFLKGDENVLFFVDKQNNLLVGNDLFSYTLNRSSKQ